MDLAFDPEALYTGLTINFAVTSKRRGTCPCGHLKKGEDHKSCGNERNWGLDLDLDLEMCLFPESSNVYQPTLIRVILHLNKYRYFYESYCVRSTIYRQNLP